MPAKLTSEQAAFVAKILRGYKPGKAALDRALAANKPQQQKLASIVIARAREQASARQINAAKANAERLARVRKMRAAEKNSKKEKALAAQVKAREQAYKNSIKALANKVATAMNASASENVKRARLEKVFNEVAPALQKKRVQALYSAGGLLRTIQINSAGQFR